MSTVKYWRFTLPFFLTDILKSHDITNTSPTKFEINQTFELTLIFDSNSVVYYNVPMNRE